MDLYTRAMSRPIDLRLVLGPRKTDANSGIGTANKAEAELRGGARESQGVPAGTSTTRAPFWAQEAAVAKFRADFALICPIIRSGDATYPRSGSLRVARASGARFDRRALGRTVQPCRGRRQSLRDDGVQRAGAGRKAGGDGLAGAHAALASVLSAFTRYGLITGSGF
jgi:hypothetical protein